MSGFCHGQHAHLRLLKDRGISAFIDLNSRCGRPKTIPDTIRIDKNGTPLCDAGHPMVPNGQDRSTGYLMWRCPFGKAHASKCSRNCSNAKYGRVIKTRPEWDIRLYTDVPHGTESYKRIYSQRTATERLNDRILNDYGAAPHDDTPQRSLFFLRHHDWHLYPSGCPVQATDYSLMAVSLINNSIDLHPLEVLKLCLYHLSVLCCAL